MSHCCQLLICEIYNIRQTQHNNYQQNDHNKQFSLRVRVQHGIEYVAKIIHTRVFFVH